MILNDLANLICTKVRQSETEDVAACKSFLTRRHEQIWNDQLWKDSLIDWNYALPSSTTPYTPTSVWLPTTQDLILPAAFGRVIGVRTDTRRLNVQSQEVYYRTDYNAFSNQGTLIEFLVLPKCVWEFDSGQPQQLQLTFGQQDNGLTINADVLEADGMTLSRYSSQPQSSPGSIEKGSIQRLDSLSRSVANELTTVSLLALGGLLTNNAPGARIFTFAGGAGDAALAVNLNSGSSQFVSPPSTWTGQLSGLTVTDSNNTFYLAVPVSANFSGSMVYSDQGGGNPSITFGPVPYTVTTIPAGQAAAGMRCRVRLVGLPDTNAQIRTLGKAVTPSFSSDGDSPRIAGVENVLISLVEADMLERARQYQKAMIKKQEALGPGMDGNGGLMFQLKKMEAVQEAYNKRVQPDDGYGNPYDLWSHPPLTF